MTQANEIVLEQLGDVTLLDIRGDITILSESSLNDAYADASNRGAGKILLKFEKAAYINSGGISVLIQLLAKSEQNNQKIGIIGLSDHFTKIFNMVGITKFAKIYATREDALKAMT
ncbi:MAG: STAS domain-containing protein [Desulfobacterales bacterium]|jgi:anti-anti-sigma factor